MVENGRTELDDILKDRLASFKIDRDRAREALSRVVARSQPNVFDAQAIDSFGRLMRENITSGPVPFRKAYIKSLVDRVEVDDNAIRIFGDQAPPEQAIADSQNVRGSVCKWRATADEDGHYCFAVAL